MLVGRPNRSFDNEMRISYSDSISPPLPLRNARAHPSSRLYGQPSKHRPTPLFFCSLSLSLPSTVPKISPLSLLARALSTNLPRCSHGVLHRLSPPSISLSRATSFTSFRSWRHPRCIFAAATSSTSSFPRITSETVASEFDPLGLNKETSYGFVLAMESIMDLFFPTLESTSPRREKSSLNRGAAGKDVRSILSPWGLIS